MLMTCIEGSCWLRWVYNYKLADLVLPLTFHLKINVYVREPYAKSNPPPQTPLHQFIVYSYIQQSGRSIKSMNAKNTGGGGEISDS